MYLSTPSSDRQRGGNAPGEFSPVRAGLRVPPAGAQPNGLFVVVEMTVLVLVAALAMVSIIVWSGGSDDDPHAAGSALHARLPDVKQGVTARVDGPPTRVGEQAGGSITPR